MSGDIQVSRLAEDMEQRLDCLVKAVFSQAIDSTADIKIAVRPVLIKNRRCFQVERFRGEKVFHENTDGAGLIRLVSSELDGRYRQVLLTTGSESLQYSLKRNGSYKRSSSPTLSRPAAVQSHNREKEYILREGENIPALVDLGVFTEDMRIVRSRYDKYKQINRFVELIDQEFAGSQMTEISILDFGCGKSYLTFILYYYFAVKRGMRVRITGYDLKEDVVEHFGRIAEKYGYEGLRFVKADVGRDALSEEYIDMVVTLHACDTATDYALDYAIKRGVRYIFSVPCCQHEINSRIKKGGELDIMLRHGIIKERLSALLTDSIRAAVLEDMGYRVDMIEFTDFEHSPKNIMIRARLGGRRGDTGRAAARELCRRYDFTQKLLEMNYGEE